MHESSNKNNIGTAVLHSDKQKPLGEAVIAVFYPMVLGSDQNQGLELTVL